MGPWAVFLVAMSAKCVCGGGEVVTSTPAQPPRLIGGYRERVGALVSRTHDLIHQDSRD